MFSKIILVPVIYCLALRISTISAADDDFQCVSYGQCHQTDSGLYQNCVYKGPPKVLNDEKSIDILRKRCPHLLTSDPIALCCDAAQVSTLEENLRTAEVVYKRCTSCVRNLGRQICDSTCAANQSSFMYIKSTEVDVITLQNYITGLHIYLTSDYMRGTYSSCSQVVMPATGRLVLDAACGAYDAAHCSHERWFGFMGDRNANPYTPYSITYEELNEPFLNFIPYNATVIPCHKPYDNNSMPCSCMDCEESCPVGFDKSFDVSTGLTILGCDGMTVMSMIVYAIGILVWVGVYIIMKKCHAKDLSAYSTPTSSHDSTRVLSYLDYFGDAMDQALTTFFTKWGTVMGSHAILVICIASWVLVNLSHGIMFLKLTTDPVDIWSDPSSQTRKEKDYFESRFQPFYRTEQIFIRAVGLPPVVYNTSSGVIEFGPAFNKEFLLSVLELHQMIQKIPGLEEICFAPLSTSASGKASNLQQCTIQSIWGYFQDSAETFNETSTGPDGYLQTYLDHLNECLLNNLSPQCLAPYGGNVEPALAVGRLKEDDSTDYRTGSAVFLNYVINNPLDKDQLKPAQDWEAKFLDLMKNWTETMKPEYMDVSYRAERSIEDELEKESRSEVWTVVLSYTLMFIYIAFGLGTRNSWTSFMVESKFTLGLFGVLLVLFAVMSALGICSYLGLPSTLLVIEVIPFLVLAVGVDNMFILVQAEQRLRWKPKEKPEEHVGRALGTVGPSILLSTLTETACFSIGTLTEMPAVRLFALYAMVALLVDFILQITVFIALMALDTKRQLAKRTDILCCFKINSVNVMTGNEPKFNNRLYHFCNRYYMKLFKKRYYRLAVVLLFWTIMCFNLAKITHVEPGLDQKLSVSKDSYLFKYFEFLEEDFTMGPPVYFVLKNGLNFSQPDMQNVICGGLNCNSDSISMQIYRASRYKNLTYVARPASSWVDDFVDWSTVIGCCKYFKTNDSFCPHNVDSRDCVDCDINVTSHGRPDKFAFEKYLPYFLNDNPDVSCAKAGHAAYGTAVNYILDNRGGAYVGDSYFMAYHTTLRTSADFYNALRTARILANNITTMLRTKAGEHAEDLEVFPYSLFYVFYEQYLDIQGSAMVSITLSLLVAFIVSCLLTGFEIISSMITIGTVIMILIDLAGLMYWWDINLNAVTLVNLVVAVGISVEFCSHIVHAFSCSLETTKLKRSEDALFTIGISVFSGITMTKLIGILVLAFAKTQIFKVLYFRMYFGIVVYGGLHSLIFLPALLTFCGADNTGRRNLKLNRESNPALDRT